MLTLCGLSRVCSIKSIKENSCPTCPALKSCCHTGPQGPSWCCRQIQGRAGSDPHFLPMPLYCCRINKVCTDHVDTSGPYIQSCSQNINQSIQNYLSLIDFRWESLILGALCWNAHISFRFPDFCRAAGFCSCMKMTPAFSRIADQDSRLHKSMHGSPGGMKSPFQVRRKPSAPRHRPVPC